MQYLYLTATALLLPTSHPSVSYGFITQNVWKRRQLPLDTSQHQVVLVRRKRSLLANNKSPSDEGSDIGHFAPRHSSLSTPPSLSHDSDDRQATLTVVRKWLLFHLPKLKPRDVNEYARVLLGEGFDCVEALGEVTEEDLGFMKLAHQRALAKKLKRAHGIENAQGVAKALNVLGVTQANNEELTVDEEECEGEEECFDITRANFQERNSSLSTGMMPDDDVVVAKKAAPSNNDVGAAKGTEGVSGSNAMDEQECEEEDEECYDITQSQFPERSKSLSTGLAPSIESIAGSEKYKQVKDFLPKRPSEEYYDITQNLFPDRPRSLSTFNSLTSEKGTNDGIKSNGSVGSQDSQFFDITQNLFPEQHRSMSSGRLYSAFGDGEKSEMNNRPPPKTIDKNVVAKRDEAASKSKNKEPKSTQISNDYVDITKQHFAPDRPSASVNIGSSRQSSKSESESSDDYVDITKQHFPDRSAFSLLVNSGTKKDGTTYGSWDESRLLQMPERNNGDSWRRRRNPNCEYLDKPTFSDDLSPAVLARPMAFRSPEPLSSTANAAHKQRFNISDDDYRDGKMGERQPLSATANAATQQRFNTSDEVYKDAFVALERQPLSTTANASPKQRFNTSDDSNDDSKRTPGRRLSSAAYAPPRQRFKTSSEGFKGNSVLSGRQPLSSIANAAPKQRFNTAADSKSSDRQSRSAIAYAPPRQRFKTSAQGYRDNVVLSERKPLVVNAAAEQRFKTKAKSSETQKDTQPLSLTVNTSSNRFNIVGRKALLTSTTSTDSVSEEVRIDVPRAFSENIEMVTVSPGKNITAAKPDQHVDDVNFSTVLASPSKVKNMSSISKPLIEPPLSMTIHSTKNRFNTTERSSSSFVGNQIGFDVPRAFVRGIDLVTKSEAKRGGNALVDEVEFSPNLSASSSIKNFTKAHRVEPEDENSPDLHQFSSNLSASGRIRNMTGSKHTSGDVPLVDINQFSADLSRVSVPKHKPGTGLKSTPFHKPENNGIHLVDENQFSADLSRVSVPKHKPGAALKSTPHHPPDDLGIDLNQFSPVPDLCPPSKPRVTKQSATGSQEQPDTDRYVDVPQIFDHKLSVRGPRSVKNLTATSPVAKHGLGVDVPQIFDHKLSVRGPRTVKNLTVTAPLPKHVLHVDTPQFSSASDLRPPSKIKNLKPKKSVAKETPSIRAPHVNQYFHQFSLNEEPIEKVLKDEEVLVDKFLDLTSQYTVNNSSMTALGSHAIISDDPFVDRTKFSNPKDLSPPSKVKTFVGEKDYFDITQSSLSSPMRNVSAIRDAILAAKTATKSKLLSKDMDPSLSRNASSVRDALSASKVKSKPEETLSNGENPESSDSEVKQWLLTRLPHLDTDDLEAYTKQLVADGFDSSEMLSELIVEDLDFMEQEHRELLLYFVDLKYWLLAYLDLNEADIESYSRQLIDDGFDCFEMLDELTTDDVGFMKPEHRRVLAKQLTKPNQGDEVEVSFDITRDSFPERPSLAFVPNHHLATSKNNKNVEVQLRNRTSDEVDEEESFDITRALFTERPSFATAQHNQMTNRGDWSGENIKEQLNMTASSASAPRATSPKAELYQFYIDKGLSTKQASELNDFYTVWSNDALPHKKKFTCVFTCPISGEHFLAGYWADAVEIGSDDGVYWYQTKKAAQHAAAAKALDCISLLQCQDTSTSPTQRCKDAPYSTNGTLSLLSLLPPGVVLPTPRYCLEDEE